MNCPEYIKDALMRRARAAYVLLETDRQVAEWLKNHHIEVEADDIRGGCESYFNPNESMYRILRAIQEAKNNEE